jgi:hypothetical protein
VQLDGTKADLAGKDFEELFERRGGVLVPRDSGLVLRDVTTRNKITLRGLAWQSYLSIIGHSSPSSDAMPTDITFGHDRNPFRAFIILADTPKSAPTHPGDARPLWDESNTERDSKIPDGLQPNTPFEGKRGILLDQLTDGDYLRRVSSGYIDKTPYREYEFVVFARATQTHTKASSSLTVTAYASLANTNTFILNDGINPAVTFEFDTDVSPGSITQGRARVNINGISSDDDARDAIIAAINSIGDLLHISASIGGAGQVDLEHSVGGTLGNQTIDITGTPSGLSKSGDMTGGTGAEGADASDGNKEIDNLPIKAFAFAYGVECGGTAENESTVGLRAVLGAVPTIQGMRDRGYIHEICTFAGDGSGSIVTPMKDYTGLSDAVTDNGYIASTEATEEVVADCDATPTIASNHVTIPSAEWDLPETLGFRAGVHERLWLKFTGGTYDGQYHKIKRVVDNREVETFSTLTANDASSVDIIRRFIGAEAFDGYVENEGLVAQKADSSDPIATVILGQKWKSQTAGSHFFGRVFSTAQDVKGIRIIFPAGVNKDYVPNKFKIQTLDNGGLERPGEPTDWEDLPASEHNYLTANFQGDAIYAAGKYGVEYRFTTPVNTKGVKLTSIECYDAASHCEIAELMVHEESAAWVTANEITLSSDWLKFSVDGGSNWQWLQIPDVATTIDYSLLADAFNAALSGYEVEVIRSEFGYLWLRGTVAGDNSDLDVDDEDAADSSTCLVKTGWAPNTSTAPSSTGVTQQITKRTVDPMTFIIRMNVSSDHPQD